MSMAYTALFHSLGYYEITMQRMMFSIWMTSLMATLVEALPIHGQLDDNVTVPIAAAAIGQLLMPVKHNW